VDPPLGSHLGDLVDQVESDYGEGSFCFEFVSGGAKNYSFKICVNGQLDQVKTLTKVRGICINSSNEDTVTFDRLKSMVLQDTLPCCVPAPTQIARLVGWRIVTRESAKMWRVCLNKRRRIGKEKTVPYGYAPYLEEEDYELLDVLEDLANAHE